MDSKFKSYQSTLYKPIRNEPGVIPEYEVKYSERNYKFYIMIDGRVKHRDLDAVMYFDTAMSASRHINKIESRRLK